MRVSHVCAGCGTDIARVRASRDDATGWPVVSCPQCGKLTPRAERDVVQDLARHRSNGRAIDARATWLTVMAAASIITVLWWISTSGLQMRFDTIVDMRGGAIRRLGEELLGLLGLSVALGGLLALVAGHWRPRALAIGIAAGVLAFPMWAIVLWRMARAIDPVVLIPKHDLPDVYPMWQIARAVPVWSVAIGVAMLVRHVVLAAVRVPKNRRRWVRRMMKRTQPWRTVRER